MRRRPGQSGSVVRKGNQWHVRYYADIEEGRKRKSIPVGPAKGKGRLTKAEAQRKGAEVIESLGVNTETHLVRAQHPEQIETLKKRIDWCRKYHKAFTQSKPGTLTSMESHLTKHLIPRLGDVLVEDITDRKVQEFVADLTRETFEMKKPNGDVIKKYKLSRKTIANVVGVLKLVVGRKVWTKWEDVDLGRPTKTKQRYYTEEQLKRIIEAASGQYRVLFALLAGTGMRIGEAAGLHVEDVDIENRVVRVRRSIFDGEEITPKSDAGIRDVDIDKTLTEMLKVFIGERTSGLLFQSRKGSPLAHGNIRNRVLYPLLKRLGMPRAGGLHSFRHSRVTMLRKAGTPADLQTRWIGHSSLKTGDRYNHANEELEYRQRIASGVGIDRVLGPNGAKTATRTDQSGLLLKPTA